MRNFREPPRPSYDYDVNRLVKTYEKALQMVQAELNTLFLTEFERAQIIAVEENIREILTNLKTYGDKWALTNIPKVAKEGIASTLYSLGLAETYEEALKIAKFNTINRELVQAIVADTQADLLAVTQNVNRRTKAAIRQASADVLRAKVSTEVTGTQSLQQALTQDIRLRLGQAADNAIVDAAGRRWKLKNYTEMLARTKMMEAHVESTFNEALERGVEFGVVSRHGGSCSKCAPWEGRIIALNPNNTQGYPTIEEARSQSLWHPSCRHTISPARRLDRLPKEIRDLNEID